RLELVVPDRPRRRDAAVVADLAEIALAEADQRGAVELRIAADEVVRPGVELLAVLVEPRLRDVVPVLDHHRVRVPVLLFAGHVGAAFEEKDPLSRGSEPMGERAAAGPGADDDDVVMMIG